MKLPEIIVTADGPLAVGSSPDLLRRLLLECDREVRDLGLQVGGWYNPALDESYARERLAMAGLSASEEVLTWFGWHNGYSRPFPYATPSPIPRFTMLGLDDAITVYEHELRSTRDALQSGMQIDSWGTGEGWLRLDLDVHGLAIDCSSDSALPRIRFATDEFPYYPDRFRAVSLCTYVTWMLYGLRNGGFIAHPDRSEWDIDFHKIAPTQLAAGFF
jgi:hypothetical protein